MPEVTLEEQIAYLRNQVDGFGGLRYVIKMADTEPYRTWRQKREKKKNSKSLLTLSRPQSGC